MKSKFFLDSLFSTPLIWNTLFSSSLRFR